jgi:hypothetical protein
MFEILQNKPYLFLVLFIGMWVSISFLFSLLSGWDKLGKFYESSGEFIGDQWDMQSIRLGLVSYRSCITLGINSSSMYLAILFPFRIGHPKLEIPLDEISGWESKGLVFRYVYISYRKSPKTQMRLSKKQADRLENWSKGSWTYERS